MTEEHETDDALIDSALVEPVDDPDFEAMRARLREQMVIAAVPQEISRRQFFQVLANRDMITREEALTAVTTGALPAAIEGIIALISDEDVQFSVRMAFAALAFNRQNWCVEMFGAMQGMSSADIDGIWRDGALID